MICSLVYSLHPFNLAIRQGAWYLAKTILDKLDQQIDLLTLERGNCSCMNKAMIDCSMIMLVMITYHLMLRSVHIQG